MTGLLVIGIGNLDCGDDAAGPLVARRLAGRVPPGVTIQVRTGDMIGLIEDWTGCDGVVLVDAAAPVGGPGVIHHLDLLRDELPPGLSFASTHVFGVADAVGLARALGQLPRHLIAYAIEGATFEPGAPVSPAVAEAVEAVATRVAADLHRLATGLAGLPLAR